MVVWIVHQMRVKKMLIEYEEKESRFEERCGKEKGRKRVKEQQGINECKKVIDE